MNVMAMAGIAVIGALEQEEMVLAFIALVLGMTMVSIVYFVTEQGKPIVSHAMAKAIMIVPNVMAMANLNVVNAMAMANYNVENVKVKDE